MKLAFIIELAGTRRQGGEQHATLNVASFIQKNNNTVDIYSYTSHNKNFRINSLIPLSLRLLPFIRDMFFVPLIGKNTIKKIENNYDAIFASSTTLASLYKPKTTFITICHIIRSQKFETMKKIPKYKILFNPFFYSITAKLEKRSLSNSDKIVVIRQHQKEYLVNVLKINKDKIHVIPNGINTNIFKPLKAKKKNQIIFVGRGTVPKGLDQLLKAVDSVNANLLIVTQKIDENLRILAESKKNVSIIFNVKPKELARLYSESKVFVLPSLDEEQPLTTLEAMACGLPVVVSPKAASDVVLDNVNGFIVKNIKELSLQCNKLLSNETLIAKMGITNGKEVKTKYSISNVVKQITSLI